MAVSWALECLDAMGSPNFCPDSEAPAMGDFCDSVKLAVHKTASYLYLSLGDSLPDTFKDPCPSDVNNTPTTGTITVIWLDR